MATTNLGVTEITEAQSNKHVTANAAFEALDNASNAVNTVTIDATADTAGVLLTQANLAAGVVQKLVASGADGDFNLQLPANARLFIVDNQSGYTATVMVDPDQDGADGATFDVITGSRAILISDGTNVYALTSTLIKSFTVAVSDETTALTTGTGKVTFRAPEAMNLVDVRASLTTVSSSGIVSADINEGGVSVLSTVLSIDANEKTSTTAATPAVISDASIADDAEITIDIDAAGTGATGLKVTLYYT